MTDTVSLGTNLNVNLPLLDQEMRAAGVTFYGLSKINATGEVLAHVEPGTDIAPLQSVLAAHNPAGLTAEQLRAQKAQAALAELGAADYQAWLTGVQGITTLAQAKTRLEQLGRVVWLLLQAQKINELP